MKRILITSLLTATLMAPIPAHAQHGHGGGGHGGGFHGGAMGHAVGAHPGGAPAGHMAGGGHYGGGHFGGRPDYHGGWYHGNWGGGWGYRPWGWGGYGGYWGPGFGWGFGLGAVTVGVGMGSPWGWGYYNYYNPYWAPAYAGGASYINYSQPVVYQAASPPPQQYAPAYGAQANGAVPPPPAAQSPARTEALSIFENARNLFMQGNYKPALTQTDRAIALLPSDTVMHEFRALCLFAMKDYQQSAAAIYAVTSTGPGWDWTTVSNLYPDINAYTGQLRALETYCEQNGKASGPRFLLAYHYMLAGHNEQAAGLLTEVVRLEPRDQLSAQLLKGLTTPPGQQPVPADARVATGPPGQPVDEAGIIGDWKASRPDGSNVELNLTEDKKFIWRFSQQGKPQQMSGTYTLANNFLILSASDQNSLVGQVNMQPGDKLAFKLAGGNPADPGLTFTR